MLKTFIATLAVIAGINVQAADFNGTWIHSDPESHNGFRVYEKDYLTIVGDQATLTRSMGEHRALHTAKFYFKAPETCKFDETDYVCQVSETRLRLCLSAWSCDEYVKTNETAPSAPAQILDRASGRFVIQFKYLGEKYAKVIPAERLLPTNTNYPQDPIRVTLYTDSIQMVQAVITTYWIKGRSDQLTGYATEIQLYAMSMIGGRDEKIGITERPEFLGPQKTFGFDGQLGSSVYQLDFFSLL